jgi:hypothetical protein
MVLEPSINELIVSDTQGQSISVTLKGSSQPVTAIAECFRFQLIAKYSFNTMSVIGYDVG